MLIHIYLHTKRNKYIHILAHTQIYTYIYAYAIHYLSN